MKYYLVGIKGSTMSALSKILKDMNHKITIERFDNYKLNNDYFYIIGNAFVNSEIKKNENKYYPQCLNSLFNLPKMAICVNRKNGVMTRIFGCDIFYPQLKLYKIE